jgi:hypothetical protein
VYASCSSLGGVHRAKIGGIHGEQSGLDHPPLIFLLVAKVRRVLLIFAFVDHARELLTGKGQLFIHLILILQRHQMLHRLTVFGNQMVVNHGSRIIRCVFRTARFVNIIRIRLL